MNKKNIVLAAGAALLMVAQNGFAGVAPSPVTLNYTITLSAGCTVTTTGGGVNFGTYAVDHADLDNQPAGDVTVTCDPGLAYRVMVGGGLYSTGATRRMYDGIANYINYDLQNWDGSVSLGDANPLDASYTPSAPWANGLDQTSAGSETHSLLADVQVNGMAAGTYTDQVAVTVTW